MWGDRRVQVWEENWGSEVHWVCSHCQFWLSITLLIVPQTSSSFHLALLQSLTNAMLRKTEDISEDCFQLYTWFIIFISFKCLTHLLKTWWFLLDCRDTFSYLHQAWLCPLVEINKIYCSYLNVLVVWYVYTVCFRFLFLLFSCGVQLESISWDGDLWSRSLGMGRNWILDVIPSLVIGKWSARTIKVTTPLLKRKRSVKRIDLSFLQCSFSFHLLHVLSSQYLCITLTTYIEKSFLHALLLQYFWDIFLWGKVGGMVLSGTLCNLG